MSADYTRLLDRLLRVFMHVEFKTDRRDVVDYSIVLLVEVDGELQTVRLYDGAHGENELHRHTQERGKQPAEIVHHGSLGQGMRAAIEARRLLPPLPPRPCWCLPQPRRRNQHRRTRTSLRHDTAPATAATDPTEDRPMTRRTGLGRHGRIEDAAGDPLDGLVTCSTSASCSPSRS